MLKLMGNKTLKILRSKKLAFSKPMHDPIILYELTQTAVSNGVDFSISEESVFRD